MAKNSRRGAGREKLKIGDLLKAFADGTFDQEDVTEANELCKALNAGRITRDDLDVEGLDPALLKAFGMDDDGDGDEDDGGDDEDDDEDVEEERGSRRKVQKSKCPHSEGVPGKHCPDCGEKVARLAKSFRQEMDELAEDTELVAPGSLSKSLRSTEEGEQAFSAFPILQDLADRDAALGKALTLLGERLDDVEALRKEVKALRKAVGTPRRQDPREDAQTQRRRKAGDAVMSEIAKAIRGYAELSGRVEELEDDRNDRPRTGNPPRERESGRRGRRLGKSFGFGGGMVNTAKEAIDLIRAAERNRLITKSVAAEACGRVDYVGKAPGLDTYDDLLEQFHIPTDAE